MKFALRCAAWLGILFAANIVHAQLNTNDLAAIEATTPLSADEVPFFGTFYSAAYPDNAPAPANFLGFSAWNLGGGYYLLDDLGGGFHPMLETPPPGGYGTNEMGDVTNYFSYIPPTNGLYLQITNAADGMIFANMNGATDCVYEIFSTTNLAATAMALTNWDIETEVFPEANTNSMPFCVPVNDRNPLFLWARDWTGITSNENMTPEWWFWYYFGTIDLSDDNLDSQGNTLLYDYQNKINPNPFIGFSAQFPNVVQDSVFDATVTVYSGEPFYEAVLVNDTNTADAVWLPYSGTNIAVSLNSGNGVYTVSVGLRGRPSNAAATWVSSQVVLENLTPVLTVTNPVGGIVSQPMIQVQGLVSETLSNLTYDVSNSLGIVSNQQGYWSPSYFDTNVDDFTTNTFQCYDVQLASGMNTITLYATDSQGNTTTASVDYTLDYSGVTNPPSLSILWPQNGTTISGGNFTLQAQVDDDTATVTAQITDASGDTNTIQGLVERSGLVWVQNLPLAAGTNILTVTATNAAGLSTTTNLTLVQSAMTVTVDPLSQVNQTSVTVTGTVSDPDADVWVNGQEASIVDDEGDWVANVPVSPVGTAIFNVQVYSDDTDSQLDGLQSFNQPQPPVVAMMSYAKETYSSSQTYNNCYQTQTGSGTETVNWLYQSGGSDITSTAGGLDGDCDFVSPTSSTISLAGGYNGYQPAWEIDSWQSSYYVPYWDITYQVGSESYTANTKVMIMPSDQATIGQQALYLVSAQVFDEDTGTQLPGSSLRFLHQIPGTPTVDMADGSGNVWSQFLVVGPAGVNPETTPVVPLGHHYSFNPPWNVTNITLQIVDNNNDGNVLSGQTNNVIVGQQMYLGCQLNVANPSLGLTNSMLSNFQWTVPGYAISNYVVVEDHSSAFVATNFPTTNSSAIFYWVDGASNRTVQCSATINGVTISGQAIFNVVRPTIDFTGSIGTVSADTNYFLLPGQFALHLGGTINNGTTNYGIVCTASNPNLFGYDDDTNSVAGFNVVQVIMNDMTSYITSSHTDYTTNINGLDNFYPTQNMGSGNGIEFYDAPGDAGFSTNLIQLSIAQSFRTVLVFIPDVQGEVIPIPIKEVDWNYSGSILYTNNQWILTSSNAAITINNQGTTCFPTWTNVIYNYNLQP